MCDSGHVGTPSPPPLSALRSPLRGGAGEADESARWLLATGIISSSWPPFKGVPAGPRGGGGLLLPVDQTDGYFGAVTVSSSSGQSTVPVATTIVYTAGTISVAEYDK